MQQRRLIYLGVIVSLMGAGVFYYCLFFFKNGYLPSPFLYAKFDTFMDLFNSLWWTFDEGFYTEWGSIYPPLNIWILRLINYLFSGQYYDGSVSMRENSPFVIAGFLLIYLAIPVYTLHTKHWDIFSIIEKLLIYLAIIFSAPMLFALERGNMVVLCLILITIALSKIGFVRCFSIALLINLKPYFAIFFLYYIIRKNWKGLATCTALSGLFFAIPGLVIDNHFLVFLKNILLFSQEKELFSLREILSFPSSISSFSYVLKNQEVLMLATNFISNENISFIISLIETVKWVLLATSVAILVKKSSVLNDVDIFTLLIVIITNIGIWVGGYTLLYYIALIPSLTQTNKNIKYIILLSLIALPIDIIPLFGQYIGYQQSYLSDSTVNVYWTLGLGSVLRPLINIIFLIFLSYDFLFKTADSSNDACFFSKEFLITNNNSTRGIIK